MIHITSDSELDAYMAGEWWAGPAGELYVVPRDDLEPFGPDDRIMALILRSSVPPSATPVPRSLRRWTPEDGFYHA